MREITSADNPIIKHIGKLHRKKHRAESCEFLAEGTRLAGDVIRAGWEVKTAVYSAEFTGTPFGAGEEIMVPAPLFARLCETEHPQGVLLVVGQRPFGSALTGGTYVFCDRVADPGNLGTILRSADALGMDGVILSPGCADVYGAKTVRATMGSICHIPLFRAEDSVVYLKQRQAEGYCVTVSALSDKAAPLSSAQFPKNSILVVGSEATGAAEEIIALADQLVMIPMHGQAESLNASIAAAILMYEAGRNHG